MRGKGRWEEEVRGTGREGWEGDPTKFGRKLTPLLSGLAFT